MLIPSMSAKNVHSKCSSFSCQRFSCAPVAHHFVVPTRSMIPSVCTKHVISIHNDCFSCAMCTCLMLQKSLHQFQSMLFLSARKIVFPTVSTFVPVPYTIDSVDELLSPHNFAILPWFFEGVSAHLQCFASAFRQWGTNPLQYSRRA